MTEIGAGWEQLGHPQTRRSSKKISFYCSSLLSVHFVAPLWDFTCFKSVFIATIKTQLNLINLRLFLTFAQTSGFMSSSLTLLTSKTQLHTVPA